MQWQLVVEAARDENGKRTQRYKSFSGPKSGPDGAEAALRVFINEVERGFGGDTRDLMLGSYLERWLEYRSGDGDLRPSTLAKYRDLLERHVSQPIRDEQGNIVRFSGLGKKRLDDVTPSDIERLYNRIRRTGNKRTQGELSGRSVLHVHRTLFAAMQRAVSWRLISSNPCVAEAPKAKRYEARTLTADEGRRLIETARGTRLHLPIMLALGCGLRRGEVCAIKWAGVDFERGTVHVSESIQDGAVFVAQRLSEAGEPSRSLGRSLRRFGFIKRSKTRRG
jgi:integrase